MKHKEVILTGILLTVLALAVVAVAQPLVTRKWQDALAKPNHGWMTTFGYSDGSHLAYHIVTLMENDQKLNAKIVELEKQLASASASAFLDSIPYEPNYIELPDELYCSSDHLVEADGQRRENVRFFKGMRVYFKHTPNVPDARDIEQYKDTLKRTNEAVSDPNVPDPNEVTK